jgi:hypothetical protein
MFFYLAVLRILPLPEGLPKNYHLSNFKIMFISFLKDGTCYSCGHHRSQGGSNHGFKA